MGKWSETAKINARRKKAAKRLYKKWPLFAFELMASKYHGYTYKQFTSDLLVKKAPVKREGKKKALTFKQEQLYKIKEAVRMELKTTGQVNYVLVQKYNKLQSETSAHIKIPVNFQGKTLVVPVPHNATTDKANKLAKYINNCCDIVTTPEELKQVVSDYITRTFTSCK